MSLEAKVTGNPHPAVTWNYDDVLTENDVNTGRDGYTYKMTILDGSLRHKGIYSVILTADNEYGKDTKDIKLTAYGKVDL